MEENARENNRENNGENNGENRNTEQTSSGGMLYSTEPQPQEEAYGTSAVYGYDTKIEPQPDLVQQPKVQESEAPQSIPVQLSKVQESNASQPMSGQQSEVQGSKMPQSLPVQLSKVQESEAPQPVSGQQSEAQGAKTPQALPVQLSKTPEPAQQPDVSKSAERQIQAASPINPDWAVPQQGSFYQQGSGQPMNNPPTGFGPVQTPPPIQGAPVPKPKKRKTGLLAGILCAAAVVIVIAVGVLLSKALFGGGGAKAQLAKGFANMAKEMAAYRSLAAEDIGLAALNKMKAEQPIHTNIDVSFTDPNAKGSINSLDLEIDAVSDYKKKMGEYKVSAGTYGIDMSIGNIVAADNTLYISVPVVFKDKVYSLDLSNLGKDFNNSAWSELMGEKIPEEYAVTLFDSPNTAVNIKDAGMDSELYKIMSKHGRTVSNAMTFETIKDKKTFTLDGTDTAYGGVRLTVDKDAYNEAAAGICDDILASDFYKEAKKGYQNIYGTRYGEDMDEIIEIMFDMRFEQDLMLDFYLDKKGRIVNISTPEDMAVSGEHSGVESMAVDIDFSGSERALDSIDGGVYMQAGDEIIYMGISRNAEITDEYYTEDLTVSIQEDDSDEEIAFWYTNQWGYEDYTFDLDMGLMAGDEQIGLRADGSFVDIVKGKGYTFQLDHAAVFTEEEDLLLMTGSINTEQTQNKIEVPKNAENFLEMTSKDIQELFYGTLF